MDAKGACRWYTQIFACSPPTSQEYVRNGAVIGKLEKKLETVLLTQRTINSIQYRKIAIELEQFAASLNLQPVRENILLMNRYRNTWAELQSVRTGARNDGSEKGYEREIHREKATASWNEGITEY